MVNFSLAHFFEGGLKKGAEVAEAKSAEVEAEATASANDLTDKTEAYETEKAKNKMTLRENADAVKSLIGNDAGKIRTVMKTYGNVNVLAELQKDFANYQAKNIAERKTGQFKSLSEYVNGRISGTGNTLLTDEAAEQVSDEAAIAGDELDIQKAEKRAKGMGVSVEEYLENQAKKMTVRPAFDIDKRAARLVEQSKMGAFGTTLTLEEAKKQITKDKITPDKAEELEDSGYAMERDGGLSAEEKIKLKALQDKVDPKINQGTLLTREKAILKGIDGGKYVVSNDGGVTTSIVVTPDSKKAMLGELNRIIAEEYKDLDKDSQKIIMALKEKYEQPSEEKPKSITINDVIQSKKKSGKTNQQIAQELVDKGKAKTLEEALKIVEGV